MKRVVLALVFLCLVSENPSMYGGSRMVKTPLQTLDDVFYAPSPLKLPYFFFVVAILLMATLGKKATGAPPMKKAIQASIFTMLLWAAFGVATGGVFQQVPWQIYTPIVFLMFSLLLIESLKTAQDIETLGKVIFAAALWRAGCGIVFYTTVVKNLTDWRLIPAHITTHDDSTLFVTGLAILAANAANAPKVGKALWHFVLLGTPILYAIQINNRRLAYVSFIGSMIAMYAMLPKSKVRKRLNRVATVLAPIIILYVAVGWGRSERIFKPLKALSSMDAKKDSSTASREAENDGLITTFEQGNLLGTGWGHKYIEVNSTYRLTGVFDQWQYIPHNSLLGLLAFTGMLGFLGTWIPLPVCAFLNARVYRATQRPFEKAAAMVGVAEVVIYANQVYGDMGFGSQTSLTLIASSFAVAGRLAATSGAWPMKGVRRVPNAVPARANPNAGSRAFGGASRAGRARAGTPGR